jgi:hypothetical protein
MNPRIDQLVKTLLQKESIHDCSLPELRAFADRHPYFGAAQLLLAKKLQTDEPENYLAQLQKTFGFFHNPLWVEHLLDEHGSITIIENVPNVNSNKSEAVDSIPAVEIIEPGKNEVENISNAEDPQLKKPPVKVESISAVPGNELVFEPYHSVDYFASQGIKVKEEEKPVDRFSQQLKSFTGWLKTMKRLSVAEIAAQSEPVSEQKIEKMATESLQEREVITEAMAQVWEKQGNMAKAIEIYKKLGLLEPSKSAYFAAKIEELRKTN